MVRIILLFLLASGCSDNTRHIEETGQPPCDAQHCGYAGGPCCENLSCGPGLLCNRAGVCEGTPDGGRDCGVPPLPCCAGGVCENGFSCAIDHCVPPDAWTPGDNAG